ncbi:hypothetical protein ALC60_03106 [Trachymyrmex zeteki]|uniref:Uncharacterized protein n=1 Tax=Mycetomoellerius zeteki TaxID=64791 RepID=A0A151XCG3_9HYME|nr:hypothetical protein ALC60_03106 [Trachymyrmex zeteki]
MRRDTGNQITERYVRRRIKGARALRYNQPHQNYRRSTADPDKSVASSVSSSFTISQCASFASLHLHRALFLSPFTLLNLSFALDYLESSFPKAFLSFFLHDLAFSFVPYYPSSMMRARFSVLFRCFVVRYAFYYTFRFVLSSSLSPFPSLNPFSLFSSRSFIPCSLPSRYIRSLPTCL